VAETAERFDLILLDLTDPETPAGSLYTEAFFRSLRRILRPGGAVVLHTGTPVFEPDQVQRINAALRAVFEQVHPFGLYVPLYGAYWGFAVASDRLQPRALDAATLQARVAALPDLQYYNAEVHPALFASAHLLPPSGAARGGRRRARGAGRGGAVSHPAALQPSRARWRAIWRRTCSGAVPPTVWRACTLPCRVRAWNTSASIAG
jgi:SAM-dependent methyltransferase